jgi:hypothetical protein
MKKLLILYCFIFLNLSCLVDKKNEEFIDSSRLVDLSNYKNYQIIQKNNDIIFSYCFTINKNQDIKIIKVYQIIYEKYKVGDIIK